MKRRLRKKLISLETFLLGTTLMKKIAAFIRWGDFKNKFACTSPCCFTKRVDW